MNVLLFGASGDIGRRIADELLSRGHAVTGVTRSDGIDGPDHEDFSAAVGDATDPGDVASLAAGHDAVASAVGPGEGGDGAVIEAAARGLVAGLRETGVDRLVVVGGAGTLEVEPGLDLVDTEDFPEAVRPVSLAHRDALRVLQDADDLEWTFFAPAAVIEPGERTGEFRLGTDALLVDEDGDSHVSMEDFAVAFVDELEEGNAIRGRRTVAY